jgi:hypothetical protein
MISIPLLWGTLQTYASDRALWIVDSLEILAGLIHPELFGAYLADHEQALQRVACG